MSRKLLPRLPEIPDPIFRTQTRLFQEAIDRWTAHKQKGIELSNAQL